MKQKASLFTLGLLLCGIFNLIAQTPTYFKKLQTQQIESTPFVKWTNVGPGMSGYVDEYFAHPTDPNCMYMSLDMGNAYYTHDNGLSWVTIKDWDSDGEGLKPTSIDFSHQNADFGYAIDERGHLLKTTDRGATFQVIKDFPAKQKNSVITVDPQDDHNWFVGAGQPWRVKSVHRSLKDYHGTSYRNTEHGHIYLSRDKGKNWTKISDGFNENLAVFKIVVDPRKSKDVYMFTNYGFYKSTDGGYHWALKGKGLPYNLPRDGDFYYNAQTGEFNLYLLEQTNYTDNGNGSVTTSGGVFKSTDSGETWISILGNLPLDYTKINSNSDINNYYKTLGYWFSISPKEAKERFPNKPTSAYSVFNHLVVSRINPNEIYLSHNIKHDFAFGPGDIWQTLNGGKSWTICGRNGTYWTQKKDKGYWVSRNQEMGMNMNYAHLDFTIRNEQAQSGTRTLLAKPDGDIICGYDQQMFRTSDKGKTWNQIDDDETTPGSGNWVGRGGSNLPGENLVTETGMSRILFCSGEHGLWISAPDGQKVKPEGYAVKQLTGQSKEQHGATSPNTAAVCPKDTNTMYILMMRQGFRGSVRRTTDGGQTWENISNPIQSKSDFSANIINQYDLTIDKEDTRNMYFCVPYSGYFAYNGNMLHKNGPDDFSKYGVYRSQDAGYHWELANNGLPKGCSVYRIEMDPGNSRTLYASLNRTIDGQEGALYRTVDGGNLWTKVSIPSGIKSVNHFFIDRNNGTFYLSAGECQGAIDDGGVWSSTDKGTNWDKIFFMPNVRETYSSNADPNTLLVNVQLGKKVNNLNSGVYFSKDGGKTWTKANYQLGQPARIHALRPDPKDPNVFWAALFGSGFYRGVLKPGNVCAYANNALVFEKDKVTLNALESKGNNLQYKWVAPPELKLSSTTDAKVTFIAPDVEKETEFKVLVYVTDGRTTDVTQSRIIVRKHNL